MIYFASRVLDLRSKWNEEYLQSLAPGFIHVLLHPQTTAPFRWSHHQKCVVIDDEISFVGGIDLCFTRFVFEHSFFSLSRKIDNNIKLN